MKTLLIVDLQQDFMPGGALPVPEANVLIAVINDLQKDFDLVIASQDWHPPHHISFASTHHKKPGDWIEHKGVRYQLWPDHCIQGTLGAAFPSQLYTKKIKKIIHKGVHPQVESYSAFFDAQHASTGLFEYLKTEGVTEIFVVGVATDYCVKATVLDACSLSLKTNVIRQACRGLDGSEQAFKQMEAAGAYIC
ncbi:MAG: bifunctional nicotinamidase/pyrazinamidase [Verrucomicrobia bacterium]|nr:bifunctional nicotinamidase/pyrazinamidase [Verrucomicrobiota bacterium]MBS0646902.1 bifunctional nicotinamidase/pyrazinamidase [Verrucomicrobiota bacterium]